MRPIRLVGTELLGGQVAFQVVCQPDNDPILLNSAFRASNGMRLTAQGHEPQWDRENDTLYLRGDWHDRHLNVLTCDWYCWNRICKAVEEYNGHYPLCPNERAE